jgi:hypothetical protein
MLSIVTVLVICSCLIGECELRWAATYQRSQGLTASASCELQDFLYVPQLSVR